MKKLLVIKTMIIALCLSAIVNKTVAQNDADPAITSMSFAASPIVQTHTTTLTVFFVNNGFTTAITAGSVGLNISLPTSGEYMPQPVSAAAISGTFASKFNWTYNSTTHNFFGTSNQSIAAGAGGTIVVNVMGVDVTPQDRISVANIQRLNPSQYPNENVNNNNLTAALGVVPGSPQPILLLNFDAVKQGTKVQLSWQTSSEINSDHFEIEYSKDGNTWNSLGNVAAAGFSSITKSYGYLHGTPVYGANFYRLKQVDIGGSYVYSPTKVVSFSNGTGIKVLPNPVVAKLYVTSDMPTTFQSVAVFTAEGKLLQQNSKVASGSMIDMNRYTPGTYMIKVVDAQGTTQVYRIIKERL